MTLKSCGGLAALLACHPENRLEKREHLTMPTEKANVLSNICCDCECDYQFIQSNKPALWAVIAKLVPYYSDIFHHGHGQNALHIIHMDLVDTGPKSLCP